MASVAEIISRWDANEGKPYKGKLIDFSAFEADPSNIGCMCAQGQVLHLVAGWSPEKLRDTEQGQADSETAKLLNISVAHAILLRQVNDSVSGAPAIVLTHPEKVLCDQARTVLAFWLHFDRMTDDDWRKVIAARGAAGDAAWDAAWAAAGAAAGDAARAAANAASEIQGAAILRERGQLFFFLPMFGFADPEAIPALPADYGLSA